MCTNKVAEQTFNDAARECGRIKEKVGANLAYADKSNKKCLLYQRKEFKGKDCPSPWMTDNTFNSTLDTSSKLPQGIVKQPL